MDLLPSERPKFIIGDAQEASISSDADEDTSQIVGSESSEFANPPGSNTPDEVSQMDAEGDETLAKDPSTISQSENNSATDLATKARAKGSFRTATSYTQHIPTQALDIIEYEWPEKSGDFYFVQEQISQLLDVKSFKRKYPDLARRTIESDERESLTKDKHIANVLSVHLLGHITALRSVEVLDLMSAEYPIIHAEYQKVVAERRKLALMEKQKELDLIKSDAKKLEELRKKAIKSASQFNQEMQTTKNLERKYFLDTQTSVIQSAANRWLRLAVSQTRPSAYPVTLIPGQFASHYKKFSAEELYGMPLNSVLENDRLFPPKRDRSPSPIHVANAVGGRTPSARNDARKSELMDVDMKIEADAINNEPPPVVEKPAPLRGRRPSTASNGTLSAKRQRKSSAVNRVIFSEAIATVKSETVSMTTTAAVVSPSAVITGDVFSSKAMPFVQVSSVNATAPPLSYSPIPEEAGEPAAAVIQRNSADVNDEDEVGHDEELDDDYCIVCNLNESDIPTHALSVDLGRTQTQTPFVRCADCGHQMHAGCIDMPPAMIDAVRMYAWRCAECKECTVCGKQDQEPPRKRRVNEKNEEKRRYKCKKSYNLRRSTSKSVEKKFQDAMMCCDLCDRGYHTFCTGVTVPPSTQFVCVKCRE